MLDIIRIMRKQVGRGGVHKINVKVEMKYGENLVGRGMPVHVKVR